MKTKFFIPPLFVILISTNLFAEEVKSKISYEGDTFNFELTGQKNWDYDLKKVIEKGQTKVQLFVKSLNETVIQQIKNIENPFVKSVTVQKNAIDNRWLVEFTLKNDQVETFDYLTDQPSKLIIDFYKSEQTASAGFDNGVNQSSSEDNKKSENKSVVSGKGKKSLKSKSNRKPADADILKIEDPAGIETSILAKAGLYDAGDAQFSRFIMRESDYSDEAVIKSRNNYYLRFPELESEFAFWEKMKESPPVYEIKPENSDENKQARLLLKLFSKQRYLVFTQTFEWFQNKFPNSKYQEMFSFMMADAYTEAWRKDKNDVFYEQAQNAYREALEKYPDSTLAERTSLLMGMLAIDRKDNMSAIRKLRAHIENPKYAKNISSQYAKIGLAHSYSKINKLDEALKYLADIEKNTNDELVRTEVAVRRGDFYFFTKKFNESIAAYESASEKFPLVSKLFPSAFFNKMEALFWKEKFKESHNAALGFAQHFPAHEFAPYALTRVGELLDIMGASQEKSVGAYLETHFRYGDSPKTIVARLHLLSARMKGMKKEELDQTLIKMDELSRKSELSNIDQFKVAMISDGFARRKEYLRAIDILSKFYQENPTRPDVKQVTQRIVKNINDELKNLSDQQKFKDLLKTYKQYADTWLKTYSRFDTDYFLGLSYESAGAFSDAIEKYSAVLKNMNLIKNTSVEKEIYVNQYLPSFDSINLRLAKNSLENFSYQDSYQFLEKIKNPLGLNETEQIERVNIAAKLNEEKGDNETAIRYLTELSNLWTGEEKLVLPILFKLAEMQEEQKNYTEALVAYQKASAILLKNSNSAERDLHKLADRYTKLLVSEKNKAEAINLLSSVIQKFGANYNFDRERYRLGELFFENGEIKKAEQAWDNIQGSDSNVWKRISEEKLKQAAWDTNYKKHLKRIPAMSQLEDKK